MRAIAFAIIMAAVILDRDADSLFERRGRMFMFLAAVTGFAWGMVLP
jgi:hypothetical protein